MKISGLQSFHVPFVSGQETTKADDKNPISKAGEREKLLKATVIAGIGLGARALWWLYEEGFEFENLFRLGTKLVDKNKKGLTGTKRTIAQFGAFSALTVGFIGLMAAIYTAVKTPEVLYNGDINAFKKSKDIDVYVKGNKVERELYDQMNEKAKEATPEDKKKLSEQYLKLKAAKNQTPDFIEAKSQSEIINK